VDSETPYSACSLIAAANLSSPRGRGRGPRASCRGRSPSSRPWPHPSTLPQTASRRVSCTSWASNEAPRGVHGQKFQGALSRLSFELQYDGATSTARKGFVPGPAAAGSTSGTLWASFRQNLMSCRPLCQELWYDFYMILVHFLPHQATLDALRAACVRRTRKCPSRPIRATSSAVQNTITPAPSELPVASCEPKSAKCE